MRRSLLLAIAAILVCAPNAFSQIPKQPRTPAPTYSVAWAVKDGGLMLSRTVTVLKTQVRERVVRVNGKDITERVTVQVPVLQREYVKMKLAGLEFFNAAGEKQSAEDVRDALEKPKIVLVSRDGRKVDPFYLKVVKRDTLIIVDKRRRRPKTPRPTNPGPPRR